jgi:L-lactate dehydrogenase complex protein LldF
MAHAVRADTITNLEVYLDQFILQTQANGIAVHRATTASEANKIVLEIIRAQGTDLVAKSKSMVSEEIELNHALEAAGVKSVETDLGEYIVQLRRERPSHIITPAVHLTRQQVGDTFERELGIPHTDDVNDLTAAAHQQLRRIFLTAGVGISGVNFGVAESGALCIVTNEGNGRMVTTLPPVHIALMGVERLVPTWEDLALMLSLLPRSATGQKLTVYVNLIRGPRRLGEFDGARSRHLILIDDGRSALRGSPLEESLLCIRCGACLNACPIFREIGGHAYVGRSGETTPYPGPIGSVISPGLFSQGEFGQLARASTLCGACREACPVDIDLPKLLLRTRAGGREGERERGNGPGPIVLGLRVYTWLATDARRFRSAQRLAATVARLISPRSPWMRFPAFTGWGISRRFPRPAEPFSSQLSRRHDPGSSAGGSFNTSQFEQDGGRDEIYQSAAGGTGPVERSFLPLDRDLIERFAEELRALGGEFRVCSPDNLAEEIISLLHQRDIKEVLSWESSQLPVGLLDKLHAAGIRRIGGEVSDSGEDDPAHGAAGITGAQAAVAETGTLVLSASADRPLSTSLLPEIHIAILQPGDIYKDLPQILALPVVQEASSTVLISGPSRTADIEMTLTIGVHGPREVYVFCPSG